MKKYYYNLLMGLLAVTMISIGITACVKGISTPKNEDQTELISDYEGIGELHNVFLKEIRNQRSNKSRVTVSTATVLDWMDICANTAENMGLGSHDEIQESINLAKKFFVEFGDDDMGENKLFSEKVFIESEVEGLLNRTGCPNDVRMVIMEMYNACLNAGSKKSLDAILEEMENLSPSIHKNVFVDIYRHSRLFWGNSGENEINKEAGNPPFGMSCKNWSYVMDAMGGTIGIGLGGGVFSWLVGSAVGTAFSMAADNDCEENVAV